MEKRKLGRTGHESTVVTFGTAGLGRVTQEVADKAIQQVLDAGVNHIDIAPTLIELAGLSAPDSMRGTALVDKNLTPTNPDTPFTYAEIDFEGNVVQAVRTLDEKLIHANVDNTRGLEPIELYDMQADPKELTNLAGGGNERQAVLLQTLKDMQKSILAGAIEPGWAPPTSAWCARSTQ